MGVVLAARQEVQEGETMTPEEKAEKWLEEHPGERESWAFFGTCWLAKEAQK